MQVNAVPSRPSRPDLAAVLCFENAALNTLAYSNADVASAARADGFKGQKDKAFYLPGGSGRGAKRILLLGLGPADKADLDSLRRAGRDAARKAREAKAAELALVLPEGGLKSLSSADLAGALAEGVSLGLYKYTEGKGKPKEASSEKPSPASVSIVGGGARAEVLVKEKLVVCALVNQVRDWVNRPAGDKHPEVFAAAVKKAAAGIPRLKVKVLNKAAIQRLGMAGLLGVNQGSKRPPAFLHLHYKPAGRIRKRVALVGKGVTFDSGGLSLKPASSMLDMKSDMAGAATVAAVVIAAAKLKLKVEVHACAPITENMTGGDALKVGDVIRYSNGKTAEILNTDAEGRIILADGLLYAGKLKPDVLLDVATLTGAAIAALGMDITATLGDDKLAEKFHALGQQTGEMMWQLPMPERYHGHIESKLADMKNLGNSGEAGTVAGAMYLKEFVEPGQAWLHFDIAGPSFLKSENGVHPSGATGTPLRTLFEYLKSL